MYLGTPGQLSLVLLQYFQEGVANQGDKVYWPLKMREQDFALMPKDKGKIQAWIGRHVTGIVYYTHLEGKADPTNSLQLRVALKG